MTTVVWPLMAFLEVCGVECIDLVRDVSIVSFISRAKILRWGCCFGQCDVSTTWFSANSSLFAALDVCSRCEPALLAAL